MAFRIEVVRRDLDGTLKFSAGGVTVNTTCWWDPEVRIDAGTYTGSATWMANKTGGRTVCPWDSQGRQLREAIFLGRGVPVNGRTSNDIFIHKGLDASWSDGCIVAHDAQVWKIWQAITPKDANNVTIVIRNDIITFPPPVDSSLPGYVPRAWM